ncbi:type III secretion system effector XopAV, partial [Xanthomonas hortorum]|uniref:type III secretion system effector XopAV n=2 Tax=Xanthomonas TaxID=338 RepID=UPI001E303F01
RRAPVREARLREPNVPIGVRVANVGRQAARVGTVMASASVIPNGLIALQAPFAAAYGYAIDDPYLKNYAMSACVPVMASLSALGAAYSVERVTAWYLQAQAQAQASVTKAARAAELGTTEACLDAAIEMVTMPDAETPTPEMSEGERTALAMDLLHLATADRSRLPPEIWSAASGVGDDAYTLVSNLLAAARSRASAEASASSAG